MSKKTVFIADFVAIAGLGSVCVGGGDRCKESWLLRSFGIVMGQSRGMLHVGRPLALIPETGAIIVAESVQG